MDAAPEPRGRGRALDDAVERAAAELQGWIEGGERVVALVAPRGAERRRVLERLSAALAGRFAVHPWSGRGLPLAAARAAIASQVRRAALPVLVMAERGEELGAEGARALRVLTGDPAGARCAVVALEAAGAGSVLGELGPALEVVVLRGAARRRPLARLRPLAAAAAVGVAGASLGMAAVLLLPRFAPAPAPPSPAPSLPPVAAPAPGSALPPPSAAVQRPPPPQGPAPPPRRRAAPERPPRAALARAPAPAPGPAPAPAPGWLVVNAIPRAVISLDGALLGETPIVRHPVAAGTHRVAARFGDGRREERTVQAAGGEIYLMFDGRGGAGAPP